MSKPNYIPRADSLASQLIGFFTNHEGEVLTLDGITEQFDCTRGNIHTLLLPAREAGLIKRDKNEDGEYVYSSGKTASSGVRKGAAQTLAALKANNAGATIEDAFLKPTTKPGLPDTATVQIEDGIPIPGIHGRARRDWSELLMRLKVGQSCKLPWAAKPTLANAVTEAHKSSKHKYTMRTLAESRELRIWRVQ